MSASCSSRVRLEVRITTGRRRGADRPELGDRYREVRQELEQERLELVVGAVDLVDQQHDRLGRIGLERLEQRPRSRKRRENSSPSSTPPSAARSASSWRA